MASAARTRTRVGWQSVSRRDLSTPCRLTVLTSLPSKSRKVSEVKCLRRVKVHRAERAVRRASRVVLQRRTRLVAFGETTVSVVRIDPDDSERATTGPSLTWMRAYYV